MKNENGSPTVNQAREVLDKTLDEADRRGHGGESRGAGIGAAGGAIIGTFVGGPIGAAVGGAVGGLIGAVIGGDLDRS